MQASDIMTRDVVSVSPDTPVQEVARTLLRHGISAVPVVDSVGWPIGMVSEGDLVARDDCARLSRRDWWLSLIAEDKAPDDDFLKKLRESGRTAGDVMAQPVVTIGEDTGLGEIGRLLAQYRIKRVPVVKDGCLVGIVSRADLLRVLASEELTEPAAAQTAHKPGIVDTVLSIFVPPHRATPMSLGASEAGQGPALSATTFRNLVDDYHAGETRTHDEARRAAAEQRQQQATVLIDTHVTDDTWKTLLHRARQAAQSGAEEFLLLRFPNALCTDGGRAINTAEDDWPKTLRGEAAELYLRWEQDLKGRGFHMAARVLEFPGGMPGDIGLFLVWGSAA